MQSECREPEDHSKRPLIEHAKEAPPKFWHASRKGVKETSRYEVLTTQTTRKPMLRLRPSGSPLSR